MKYIDWRSPLIVKLNTCQVPMEVVERPQPNLPDLNEFVSNAVVHGRPPPGRYQATPTPHELHCILKNVASLMASTATITQLMMPLFDSPASFLADSIHRGLCTHWSNSVQEYVVFAHLALFFASSRVDTCSTKRDS